jgi:hypothetical protein
MRVRWERAVRVVMALRTALLTLGGLGSISLAAFLWSWIAGFLTLGVALLVLEWLTRPEEGQRR